MTKIKHGFRFDITYVSVIVLVIFSALVIVPSKTGPWGLSTVLAAEKAAPTTTKFVNYNGTKYGIDIQHPENWKLKEDANGIWLSSPVNDTGNFRVDSQPSQNMNLSTLVEVQLLQSMNSYKQMQILSSNLTNVAGVPANRTDYTFKLEVPRLFGADTYDYRAIQFSMIKGEKLYTVTYFSEPSSFFIFLPIAEKMLSSLKIL